MKTNRLSYLFIGILVIWCLILSIVLYNNYGNSKETEIINEYKVTGFSTDFTKVVQDNASSIVSINCNGSVSSGFVYKQIDNKVYILTSYHGVSEGYIYVSFDNIYNVRADIVGKNLYTDLAVLVIDSVYDIKPLNIGDSTLLSDGEFVISIGTPVSLDYANSVEIGMISSDTRVIENSINVDGVNHNYYLDVVQLSSNLKPGYSGSPILNMNGEVVGMTTMSLNDDINFALTANEIKIIADKIIAGEEVKKYQIGIKGTYINDMQTYAKSNLNLPLSLVDGLYVNKVMNGSLASIASIQVGDVITSINGTSISDLNDYLKVVYTKADVLEFSVLRGEATLSLTVNLND